MYYYTTKSDYLMHHGIPGMKWGVRRYQNEDGTLTEEGRKRLGRVGYRMDKEMKAEYKNDKKALKELRRDVAAENRNLAYRSKLNVDNEEMKKLSEQHYSEAMSKPYYFNIDKGIKKAEQARERYKELSSRADEFHQEVLRAERTNKRATDAYLDMANKMIEKYGTKRVKDIKYRTAYAGQAYAHDLLKTGFTLSYLPIFGRNEVAKRVVPGDISDRRTNRDDALRRAY